MVYSVVFTPEARAQLIALYRFIATDASPAIAQRFTDAIVDHCERFREFPARSVRRDDIRPGLHLTNYRGRVVIAFAVEGSEYGSLACFTPAKTMNRFYKRTLDYPQHRFGLPSRIS
jgi:toxin ParE1/3/4